MLFSEILGQERVKKLLIKTVSEGRIPHAQLFAGSQGCGALPMAIAYAQYLLCQNHGPDNNGGNDACNLKFNSLTHPDLHFIYPTVTTDEVKSKPKSADFLADWRQFVLDNPYGSLYEWYETLGVGNKQGMIRVEDATEALKALSLKSYEGGFKVIIIWMAEKMNLETSNKLLKLIEEPSDKTVILLIAEEEEDILATIRSRCQQINFDVLSDKIIAEAIFNTGHCDLLEAKKIARRVQGNYSQALRLLESTEEEEEFEKQFVLWVRAAFRAKGNAAAINDLISWSAQLAGLGRETQKKFLHYCIDMFRQALLLNYQAAELVYAEPKIESFKLENFAPFVNGNNIQDIFTELSDAIYHIERNGNAKIILTDLSIKLTRLIHKN